MMLSCRFERNDAIKRSLYQLCRTPKPRAWNIRSRRTSDKSGSSKKTDKSMSTLGTRRSGRLQSQTTDDEDI